ncbi:sugar ABC transporter permease [Jatrophihabitans sp. YIM 134969]
MTAHVDLSKTATVQVGTASPSGGSSFRAWLGSSVQRVKDGDLGPLPVVIGLAVIWIYFQTRNDNFLTARNLNNLFLQIAVLGTLAVGLVAVLVIGEIDLSVAAVSGFCAGVLAQLLAHGWSTGPAILVALGTGLLIGLAQGVLIIFVHMPSFVVTLTGLLVWQGLLLGLIGDAGEIRIADPFVKSIASSYLTTGFAWTLGGLLIAAVAVTGLLARRSERRLGLTPKPWFHLAARVAIVAAAVAVVITVLDRYFGVPWVLVLLVGLVVALGIVLNQTAWGQHLYAVGGNREAARRAGIGVRGSVLAVFAAAATISALAGILDASRQFAVSNAAGGGNLGLNAIAAVVIGGTSLFGGRGKAYTALLGALVVGSVANGLDLLGESAAVKNTTTGIILLAAVAVDSLSRRRRQVTGRAA